MTIIETKGKAAEEAGYILGNLSETDRNRGLKAIAEEIDRDRELWLEANSIDIKNAKSNGMSPAMLDRLSLNKERVDDIIKSIYKLITLPDPLSSGGEVTLRPNGLRIMKLPVPIGVIAIIFEARPNVAVDCAVLTFKAGNACILRGGKEAINSNKAIASIMRKALKNANLPEDAISLIEDTTHDGARELMHLDKYVDLIIPRGGRNLIRTVVKEASVPVIRTGEGVCHIYVDKAADINMAENILINAKCSRPSVCNAVECVLIHRDRAGEFIKKALPRLISNKVELHVDNEAMEIISGLNNADKEKLMMTPANDEDWDTEYDDLKLAVHIVDDIYEAMDFIREHGTGHSEAIITEDYETALMFQKKVDAAAVYVNASTRFTDGGEFGLGAEIGIATGKLHARGPMGLKELTSYKYIINGEGQIR